MLGRLLPRLVPLFAAVLLGMAWGCSSATPAPVVNVQATIDAAVDMPATTSTPVTTPIPPATPTPSPTPMATPTATSTPTPLPPTATPAPSGSAIGSWELHRGEIQIVKTPFVAIRTVSMDFASDLIIRCSDTLAVFVSFNPRIESEADEIQVIGSNSYESTWVRDDDWTALWSKTSETDVAFLSGQSEFEMQIHPVGAPSRYSKFDLSGIEMAIQQVYPCDMPPPFVATPTPTPVPMPRPMATPAPSEATVECAFDEPCPPEFQVQVGNEWHVRVESVDVDAWDVIQEENFLNDPPAIGIQYYMVKIRYTYAGTGEGNPFWGLSFSAVGDRRVVYDNGCGVIPGDITFAPSVYSGGSGVGTVCFEIAVREGGVQMAIEESFSFADDSVKWIDLPEQDWTR